MRKTEEEILRDKIQGILSNSCPFTKKNIEETTSLIITAMQTFAQQESEAEMQGFIEYVEENYGAARPKSDAR